MVYYQFDYDKYREKHYYEGYFDYQKDGFGKVCYDEDEVIREITSLIDNKFTMDNKTLKRIDTFFPFKDKNNCQRIYNEIKRIYEKK